MDYLDNFITILNMFTSIIVGLTAFIGALSAFVKPLRTYIIGKFSSKTAIEERFSTLENKIDKLSDFTSNLTAKFETDKAEQAVMKEATIASTRNDLTTIYNNAIERGYIGDYDRENFMKLYAVYTKLGGNSYVHELHEQILKMPRTKKTTRRTSSRKPSSKRK